jgi:glycolate oxidase
MISDQAKNQLIQVVGSDNYQDDPVELVAYAYDSFIEKSLPDAVIFPLTTQQVSQVLKIASQYKIPLTPRGSGTNLCGSSNLDRKDNIKVVHPLTLISQALIKTQ